MWGTHVSHRCTAATALRLEMAFKMYLHIILVALLYLFAGIVRIIMYPVSKYCRQVVLSSKGCNYEFVPHEILDKICNTSFCSITFANT